MEAARYGLTLKKPVYEEDEQENREKIDQAITSTNDKMRRTQIADYVEGKLDDVSQAHATLTLDRLKQWTDHIEQEGDATVAKIESKAALAREEAEKFREVKKKGNMEKEYNTARNKILKGQKQDDKDKEVKEKIEEKEQKKEQAKKEKKAEKKLKKIEKKEEKQKLKDQIKAEEKEKEEKIVGEQNDRDQKQKEEEDAGKTEIEKQIDSAVTKAEKEGKIPKEAEIEKVEKAVKVAAAETEKLS